MERQVMKAIFQYVLQIQQLQFSVDNHIIY